MPDLPPSALAALDEAQASFSKTPLSGELTRKLEAMHVRRALSQARRSAAKDQVPVALYLPKHGEALVILEANRLSDLLGKEDA